MLVAIRGGFELLMREVASSLVLGVFPRETGRFTEALAARKPPGEAESGERHVFHTVSFTYAPFFFTSDGAKRRREKEVTSD